MCVGATKRPKMVQKSRGNSKRKIFMKSVLKTHIKLNCIAPNSIELPFKENLWSRKQIIEYEINMENERKIAEKHISVKVETTKAVAQTHYRHKRQRRSHRLWLTWWLARRQRLYHFMPHATFSWKWCRACLRLTLFVLFAPCLAVGISQALANSYMLMWLEKMGMKKSSVKVFKNVGRKNWVGVSKLAVN